MGNTVASYIADLPGKLQPAVALWFEKFADLGVALPDDHLAKVARLVACSEFAGKVLLRESTWFLENVASFSSAADNAELDNFVDRVSTGDADVAELKSELRRYRNRYLLRVLWREVQQEADLDETLQQLSRLHRDPQQKVLTNYALAL
jgi:glutamine synthetase adenylyltransferase